MAPHPLSRISTHSSIHRPHRLDNTMTYLDASAYLLRSVSSGGTLIVRPRKGRRMCRHDAVPCLATNVVTTARLYPAQLGWRGQDDIRSCSIAH
ncbi:hypothetical protein P171DRAFT_426916 [Karstenula rhodostoma CBS 690.94]|uniref:Uncharacterized protein n=1 Tax=Karstenula rhodostoma CBS 690.94 TaxID=1392251 RepID=A0A9P4PX90_9PLEO|nr:hypothetical protein P171DRAFT_426916 [Karstenula rhodostoma CBS 690.94]